MPIIISGPTPGNAGTTKYSDIISVARVLLRDKQGANWDSATDLLPLLELMVQSIVTILANQNPEMVWVECIIGLDDITGYGPYYIQSGGVPVDFKYIARLESDQYREVVKGSRDKSQHRTGKGRPTEYWTEGFGNTKIYFNMGIPAGSTYSYTAWYIPLVARNTDNTEQTIALPPMFFESLVFWLVKLAGNMDEYLTNEETSMINIMTPVVNSVLDARASELKVEVEQLGF